MKKTLLYLCIFTLISTTFLLNSCKREEFKFEPFNSAIRKGKIITVEGSALGYPDLNILSLLESAEFDEEGNFALKATETEKFQQLLVLSKNTDNVIYIGLYDPLTKKVMVNDTSTVLSLLLANPHLMNTSQEQRQQYLELARNNSRFSSLITIFREAVQNDAEKVFDFDSNSIFYQTAAQIMKETIETIQSVSFKSLSPAKAGGSPSIEDLPGDDIVFVNPRHVFYGAGIYSLDDPLNILNTVTVDRQSGIIEFNWDISNPVDINQPAKTNYVLKDGQFRIYLAKGLNFSKILEWNDPVGRATICNTGQTFLYALDIFTGFKPSPKIEKLSKYININATRIYGFTRAISTKNLFGFVSNVAGLMAENAEGIIKWISYESFDKGGKAVAKMSLTSFTKLFENVSLAFKLISLANGPGPFFYDMLFAPEELNFYITQKNGVISTSTENLQPEAKFKITPASGIIGTNFTFDASETTDDSETLSQLLFRWDFDSDGNWDTDWSSTSATSHSYISNTSYQVTLAVKDKSGLIGTISHTVNVGGGAGTASHVLLFMDAYPWTSNAMIRMLQAYGFSEGTGVNTYEIIKSLNMASAILTPGKDLVIISNDQAQTFYNNYAASQIRFTNFVSKGGSLFWEACDNGWNLGLIAPAGIILPGNIKTNYRLDIYNYLFDPSLPLVAGIPTQMDHNYASHEYFTDLPDGTTVYCVDSEDGPTLIEFNFGDGWIIVAGQPLEHQFDRIYGAPDMGKLLPSIVAYFTGKSIPKGSIPSAGNLPSMPSHK